MNLQNPRIRTLGLILAGTLFVFGAIYIDVVLRSREAFLEGEKYYGWHLDPEKKRAYFEKVYQDEINRLERQRGGKKVTEQEYKERAAALEFEKNFNVNESSLKYAYQWYKDAYELFSPPESTWVKAARQKAPETLALWKEELRAQKIPYEDYMFE